MSWLNKYVPINFGKNFATVSKITLPNTISWILFECPNLLFVAYFLITGKQGQNLFNIIAISPFIIHYINRCLIYPLRNPSSKRVPLEIVVSATIFTTANGYLQTSLMLDSDIALNIDFIKKSSFYMGAFVFILGMYINISSDNILAQMKKDCLQSQEKGEKKEYKIPLGGLFEYVSCAHYLGEIIEFLGYGILTGSFQAYWFCFTTLMILSARARDSHQWYLKSFSQYPKNRKAIIPFLY